MSFILDALKKSESDRQGKNRPDRAHIPSGIREPSSSKWLSIVGALLLVNVVVLLIVFLKPDQPGPMSISQTRSVEQSDSFRDLVANARDRQNQPPSRSPAASPESLAAQPAVQENVAVSNPSTPLPSASTALYKTFNEVRANGSVPLSNLRLDLHVFHGTPSERFVFINMNKYGESATLEEGPVVKEIVPEGVILEYNGTRFLLPRE